MHARPDRELLRSRHQECARAAGLEPAGDDGTYFQFVARYSIEDLIGKLILAVVNFPPRRIGPFESEVLTLGVPDADGKAILVGPDSPDVALGARLL